MSKNHESDAFYKTLLDGIGDGVYFVDTERTILYWNPAAEQITGYTAEEMVGRHCYDNILQHVDDAGTQLCTCGCPLGQSITDSKPREATVFLRHKKGHRVPVRIKVSPTRDAAGEITGAVELFSDNSAHVATRNRVSELERLAMIDPLTQLPNRRYLDDRLPAEFEKLREDGCCLGVMVIDIVNFKSINDTYGHQVGDEMLKVVAHTLQSNMRPQDVVGRWGGEEFLLLIHDVDAEALTAIAERVRALVEASTYAHRTGDVSVTVSIGTALSEKNQSAADVIAAADRAMYMSKEAGKNRVTGYLNLDDIMEGLPDGT
jgi:diguanylate cyclase (GGDEF)-like protein/PAS domain S-box-containing protein